MANHESSTKETSRATAEMPEPLHRSYSRLNGVSTCNPDAQFASNVMDIARGAGVIADIMHSHLLDIDAATAGAEVRPLLLESDLEALARLAVSSLNALYQLAEHKVDFFNSQATRGARA